MDVTQWYSIALGGLVAFLISTYFSLVLTKRVGSYVCFYFLKHVLYAQVPRIFRSSAKTTRFDFALLTLFLVGNILCIVIGTNDTSDMIRRAGLMSMVNLIPLLLGGGTNPMASLCRISNDSFSRIHRWLGGVALSEGLVHAIAWAFLQMPSLQTQGEISGATAAITMAFLSIASVPRIRRYTYELFLKLHQMVTAILLIALNFHIPSQGYFGWPKICLACALGLEIIMVLTQALRIVHRNGISWKRLGEASIKSVGYADRPSGSHFPILDAVHVHIQIPRPWKYQAGQYIYLCLPGTGPISFTQWHPFYVAWWYHDANEQDNIVLIVHKRSGFTKKLFFRAGTDATPRPSFKAIIDGPYGNELDLKSYGTVLLFATGVGVAAQLPYVAQLLQAYHRWEAKTRRIALFWEVESEVHTALVAEKMTELLNQDDAKILDIYLFVAGNYLSEETMPGEEVSIGERISKTYSAMKPENLIASEVAKQRGRTIVSICANNKTGDSIRETVRQMLNRDIRLEELDFYPPTQWQKRKGDVNSNTHPKQEKMEVV